MKIYTGGGDEGLTSNFKGERLSKIAPQIVAFGELDSLNSQIGLAAFYLKQFPELYAELLEIQHLLFDLGAEKLPDDASQELEKKIDAHSEKLPELKNFILPGGSLESSQLHLCRTQTRTVERAFVLLGAGRPVQRFINRLSDYFFVLARRVNQLLDVDEVLY